jgi:hypothetical protein
MYTVPVVYDPEDIESAAGQDLRLPRFLIAHRPRQFDSLEES